MSLLWPPLPGTTKWGQLCHCYWALMSRLIISLGTSHLLSELFFNPLHHLASLLLFLPFDGAQRSSMQARHCVPPPSGSQSWLLSEERNYTDWADCLHVQPYVLFFREGGLQCELQRVHVCLSKKEMVKWWVKTRNKERISPGRYHPPSLLSFLHLAAMWLCFTQSIFEEQEKKNLWMSVCVCDTHCFTCVQPAPGSSLFFPLLSLTLFRLLFIHPLMMRS